jgi:hypothetical protein
LLGIATPLLISLTCAKLPAQSVPMPKVPPEKTERVQGHVVAYVSSAAFGAGVGPQYVRFVFGIESQDKEVKPVKILYAFFKSDGPPPDSFFDHSKLYELQVVRDPKCDEGVSSLSYEKNVESETGKELAPTYVIHFLDGAPKDILKPDAVLPCYLLRPGRYKVLGHDKATTKPSR